MFARAGRPGVPRAVLRGRARRRDCTPRHIDLPTRVHVAGPGEDGTPTRQLPRPGRRRRDDLHELDFDALQASDFVGELIFKRFGRSIDRLGHVAIEQGLGVTKHDHFRFGGSCILRASFL